MTSLLGSTTSLRRIFIAILLVSGIVLEVMTVAGDIKDAQRRVGFSISQLDDLTIDSVGENLPGDRAGMKVGDRIIAVNDTPINSMPSYTRWMDNNFSAGNIIQLKVQDASGNIRVLDVQPGIKWSLGESLSAAVLALLFMALMAICIDHWQKNTSIRLLAVFMVIQSASYLANRPMRGLEGYLPFFVDFMAGFSVAIELHLISRIPRVTLSRKFKRAFLVFAYTTGIMAGLYSGLYRLSHMETLSGIIDWFGLLSEESYNSIYGSLLAIALIWQYLHVTNRSERQQILFLIIGAFPWIVFAYFLHITKVFYSDQLYNFYNLFYYVQIPYPLGFFAAILKYDMIGLGRDLKRQPVYYLSAAIFFLVLLIIVISAHESMYQTFGPLSSAIVTMTMAYFGGLFSQRLGLYLQSYFDKGVYTRADILSRRLLNLASRALKKSKNNNSANDIVFGLRAVFNLQWCAIYLADKSEDLQSLLYIDPHSQKQHQALTDIFIRDDYRKSILDTGDQAGNRLCRQIGELTPCIPELQELDAELLVTLRYRDELIGFMLLGPRENNAILNEDEISELEHFAHQISNAFANSRLLESATVDAMTGAVRREVVLRNLENELASENADRLCIALLDFDHFKHINDNHGHLFGDKVLETVAREIQRRLRSMDTFGRYGGEEFLLIIPECNISTARNMAEDLRMAVEKMALYDFDQTRVPVTISIGLAECRPEFIENHDNCSIALVEAADRALYRAKANGRNQVVVEEPA